MDVVIRVTERDGDEGDDGVPELEHDEDEFRLDGFSVEELVRAEQSDAAHHLQRVFIRR